MNSVLIVTSVNDEHADFVSKKLIGKNIPVIRINTETFINESIYSFEWSSQCKMTRQKLDCGQSKSKNIKVVWWRLPGAYYPSEDLVDKYARTYSLLESKDIIESLESLFPGSQWINSYQGIQTSLRRVHQIKAAQQVGLTIPPTLITNNFESARLFLLKYKNCIIKSMSCRSFIKDGIEYTCYTKQVDLKTLIELKKTIHFAPVFFQKKIQKKAEYRITIIGQEIFACKIDAEHLGNTDVQLDWRMADPANLIHTPVVLPNELTLKLYKMLKIFNLSFAAIDIIYGTDDNYYFLDLNPTGQWIWIELATGLPMVDSFVNLIASYID